MQREKQRPVNAKTDRQTETEADKMERQTETEAGKWRDRQKQRPVNGETDRNRGR